MTLWGGRFEESPDRRLWRFTVDDVDRRLLGVDIEGSIAHVKMLSRQSIISAAEAASLLDGLDRISRECADGGFEFVDGDEDVHSAVERRLFEVIGPVAGKLHTGRSRNDQVALDLRLYLKQSAADRIGQIREFVEVLVQTAERVRGMVVPVYTHLQQAQAVPLALHLLAYGWMLRRSADRFTEVISRLDVSPLGAGAAGGSGLALDPPFVAHTLGMSSAFANPIDAVGSRDVIAEYAFCAAQSMVDLSRLAEEIVLWSTTEFGWVTFPDRFTTGSSALPQKKNPDIAELVRGRAARAIGDLTALLTLQKGLPMAYNRDLQEDKAAVFHADDVLAGALDALSGMLAEASFHPPEPSSWVTALDLAELLVARGVPFREAHRVVGGLVARLVARDAELADLTAQELVAAHELFTPDDLEAVDPAASAGRRDGGVATQIDDLRAWLGT